MKQGRGFRKAAVLMLIGVLLGGCAKQETAKTPSPVRSVQTLQFEVNTNLDKEFLEQAELFAADVGKLSGGRMVISVVRKQSEDLPEAEYDFAYLRNSQMSQMDPTLATLSLPFLYDDAAHLSLALNAPETMKILRERLRAKAFPLTALSSGDALFVTIKSGMQKDVDTLSYFGDLTVALHESSSEIEPAFQALGARTALFPDAVPLTSQLGRSVQNVRPPADNAVIDGAEATREEVLAMTADPDTTYIIETMHDISPVWLTAKADTWKTLSEWERAVIQEAAAGLISGFEENRSRYRASWEKEVGKKGITLLQPERQALTAVIYDTGISSAAFPLPEYFDKRLFDLIQSYS